MSTPARVCFKLEFTRNSNIITGVIITLIIPGAAGGGAGADSNKSVMFSDGIRPGGDLTELDGRPEGHR